MGGPLDLLSSRGVPMCRWYGCRKKRDLRDCNGDQLCTRHVVEALSEAGYERHLKTTPDAVPSASFFRKARKGCGEVHVHGDGISVGSTVDVAVIDKTVGPDDIEADDGRKLCHWRGCVKTGARKAFSGRFCAEHISSYAEIRRNITHDGSCAEYLYRCVELQKRKQPDRGHVVYAANFWWSSE